MKIKVPADPSLILWENLGVGKIQLFFWSLLVWTIALILMLSTFAIIIISKHMTAWVLDWYKMISCPYEEVSKSEAYLDITSQEPQGLMDCYCNSQFYSEGYKSVG